MSITSSTKPKPQSFVLPPAPDGPLVLAISGGVDSVVMLDLLAKSIDKSRLVVAHFDHKIRDDSGDDARFVSGLATKYGIIFELGEAKPDSLTSENDARTARYKFLVAVAAKHNARIATAHHQDDVLETAVFNLRRGTGLRGVINMLSPSVIYRPLINLTKQQTINYALAHRLEWSQDSTNSDPNFSRNQIRMQLSHINAGDKARFMHLIRKMLGNYNQQLFIMTVIKQWLDYKPCDHKTDTSCKKLRRDRFVTMPMAVRESVLHHLIRESNISRQHVLQMAMFASAADNGKIYQLSKRTQLRATPDVLHIESTPRRS